MDVVAVAVVGGAQGNDRVQALGLARGHLQAVKAAPRNTHHAHASGTPGLRHQPRNHIVGVLEFLFAVFVKHQAVGVAVAAHVHPHAGVAVAGQVRVRQRIAHHGAVAFAVGQVFQNHGHRVFGGVGGHPDAGGELGAVGQGDEEVGRLFDFAGEGFHSFHGNLEAGGEWGADLAGILFAFAAGGSARWAAW